MPSLVCIVIVAIAGICLYIGSCYLLAVRSVRRHRQPLLFGLLCMLAGVYFILTLYGYKSVFLETLILVTRWTETLSLVMSVIIIWFLADYSNSKPGRFLVGITAFTGILAFISAFLPLSVTWRHVDAVVTRTTPWNEPVSVLTGTVSFWGYASFAAYAAIIGFGVAAFHRLYMVKNRRNANYLLIPLTLAIFSYFNDILLTMGLINSFYLMPYVYITLILFIGNNLETRRLRALENYHTLFDAINDAVTVHDAYSGRLLDANRAASRIFGAARNDLLAGDISRTLLMSTFVSDHTKELILAAHRDEPLLIERLFKRQADGKEIWIETALRSETIDGNPVILAVTRNIDSRKKVEKELEKAQRLESLGVMAGGIAHDFNNLLGGVYGHICCARQIAMDKEVVECLEATLGTLARARGLTQQLLTFSKGGTPVLKTAFIRDVVRESSQFALHGSTTTLSLHLPDDIWPCTFDANQLAQVIENIVINAHQAMPAEGGRIVVSAENVVLDEGETGRLKAGKYVKIALCDNGSGIPREIAGKIFDPFFSTKEHGCGLGLSTAFSIMKRHGGTIDFDTVPGGGTTFRLYLPASDKPPADKSDRAEGVLQSTGHVLIMDDEESIRKAVGMMLKLHGFTVTTVKDGAEALECFDLARRSPCPFTAVLLDLTIPGKMGGKETVAELRRRDADVPLYVYSGYAEDPIIAHPAEYGFTGSIRKPFTEEELLEMLSRRAG